MAPSSLENPGLISLDDNGALLTTHFREELFAVDSNGNPLLQIDGGAITLSDGFAGSLAGAVEDAADAGDPIPQLSLGGNAALAIVDDVENVLALALILEAQGLTAGDFFGSEDVGLVIKEDDPAQLQKLLSGPNLGLLANIEEVIVPLGTVIEIPLSKFAKNIGFSGVDKINVSGSIEQYENFDDNLNGVDTELYDFFVLDSVANFQQAEIDNVDFDGSPFTSVDGFGLSDSVANLIATDVSLNIFGNLGVVKYQAVDSVAAIDSALLDTGPNGIDSMGVQSLILTGNVASLASPTTAIDAEVGDRLHGAMVADNYTSLSGVDFTEGYFPDVFDILVVDIASNIPTLDQMPFFDSNDLSPTGIELTDGIYEVSIEEIIDLGIYQLVSSGGTFELTANVGQLKAIADGSAANNFEVIFGAAVPDMVVEDSGELLDEFFNSVLPALPSELTTALIGADITQGLLSVPAGDLYSGGRFITPVDANAELEIYGTVADILDPSFDAISLVVPENGGQAFINVKDDASTIRDNAGSLSAVIQGFDAGFTHIVQSDDIASPLASFDLAPDTYEFDSTVLSSGNTIEIAGNFDTAFLGGVNDVLDISSVTNINTLEDVVTKDFAFVNSLGARQQTVDNLPAADIAVNLAASTLILFDGFSEAYDEASDFSVHLDNDVVGTISGFDVANGVTSRNFFGLPHQDLVLLDEIQENTSHTIPDIDLFRYESLHAVGSAFQVGEHLSFDLYGYGIFSDYDFSDRAQAVVDITNNEGDVLIGQGDTFGSDNGSENDDYLTGDAMSPFKQDVIFGLSGDDTIEGGASDDYLNGGHGDDWIVGGGGNDLISDKFDSNVMFGDAGEDYIIGGSGPDEIHGGADGDQLYGEFDDDAIYGDDGNDYIEGNDGSDMLWGGSGDDNIHAGDGNDTVDGGTGIDDISGDDGDDVITAEGASDLEGDAGNDSITLTGDFTLEDDYLVIYGGSGTDTIQIPDGTVAEAYYDIEIFGNTGYSGADGDDSITIGGDLTSITHHIKIGGNEGHDTITIEPTATLSAFYDIEIAGNYKDAEGDDGNDDIVIGGTVISTDDYIEIEGNQGNDSITIEASASLTAHGNIELLGGNGNDTIAVDGLLSAQDRDDDEEDDAILIAGGAGNDTITITSTLYGAAVDGGDGDDVISGGPGTETLSGGSGMDLFTLQSKDDFGDILMDYNTADDAFRIELPAFDSNVVYSSVLTKTTTKYYGVENSISETYQVVDGYGPEHIHMAARTSAYPSSGSYVGTTDYFTSFFSSSNMGIFVFTAFSTSLPTSKQNSWTTLIHNAFRSRIDSLGTLGYANGSHYLTSNTRLVTANETTSTLITSSFVTRPDTGTATFVMFAAVNDRLLMATIENEFSEGSSRIYSSEVKGIQTVATFPLNSLHVGYIPHEIVII